MRERLLVYMHMLFLSTGPCLLTYSFWQRAVKCLLSLGADACETWQPHTRHTIERRDDESWFTRTTYAQLVHHLGDDTLTKGFMQTRALAGTQLTALHLAVR